MRRAGARNRNRIVRNVVRSGIGAAALALGSVVVSDVAQAQDARDEAARRARLVFQPLAAEAPRTGDPITDAQVDLGRRLYYETRISKSQQLSCNSCHQLDRFGADGEPTSPGHKGQRGGRNSPTTLNAAFHVAQFWDGRAPTVEEQAKGPVLNPIEMGMPSPEVVIGVLESIPGYAALFEKAFPGDPNPISYDNFARAIGAFERKLVTPSRFDAFLGGDRDALSAAEVAGLEAFVQTGCPTCHAGSLLGGMMFQKIGLVHPYETADLGRYDATKNETDKHFFKVPSLRNVAETGPYFHDGGIATLDEAIRLMAWHQLGVALEPAKIASIRAFLESLTGTVDESFVAAPVPLPSGPNTPKPDPS
jgi:cytochrome c peroxidase